MMADIRMLQEQTARLRAQLERTERDPAKSVGTKLDDQAGTSRKAFADQKLLVDTISSDLQVVREKVDDNNVRDQLALAGARGRSSDHAADLGAAAPPPSGGDPSGPPAARLRGCRGPATGRCARTRRCRRSGCTTRRGATTSARSTTSPSRDSRTTSAPIPAPSRPATRSTSSARATTSRGVHRESVAAFDRGITDYPNSKRVPDMYWKRGMAQNALGQTDRARESWEFVVEDVPEFGRRASRAPAARSDDPARAGGRPGQRTGAVTTRSRRAGIQACLHAGLKTRDVRKEEPMGTVNRVILVGNLGRDAELRFTGTGTPVTEVQRRHDRDVQGPRRREEGRDRVAPDQLCGASTAETLTQYLVKGKQVYVEGRLKTQKWKDKEGNDRTTVEVTADRVTLLGGGPRRDATTARRRRRATTRGRRCPPTTRCRSGEPEVRSQNPEERPRRGGTQTSLLASGFWLLDSESPSTSASRPPVRTDLRAARRRPVPASTPRRCRSPRWPSSGARSSASTCTRSPGCMSTRVSDPVALDLEQQLPRPEEDRLVLPIVVLQAQRVPGR